MGVCIAVTFLLSPTSHRVTRCACRQRFPIYLALYGDVTQMTFTFPNSACEEVGGALVSAAEGMSGFTSCNGGNK